MAKYKKIFLCPYCLQEIKSHGDKIIITGQEEETDICGWCDEEDIVVECVIK